jgi:hypothetical protein
MQCLGGLAIAANAMAPPGSRGQQDELLCAHRGGWASILNYSHPPIAAAGKLMTIRIDAPG